MEQEKTMCCEKEWKHKCKKGACGSSGAVYCLGLVGAAVFFIQNADTFSAGVMGVLKALVWPAFVVYKALEFLTL